MTRKMCFVFKKFRQIVFKLFYSPPFIGVKFFTRFNGHIYLLPAFWFILQNRQRLLRWGALRLRGLKPDVVFVTVEGDARFSRLLQIVEDIESKLFVFELPAIAFLSDELFFGDYYKRYYSSWEIENKLPYRYANPFEAYYSPENDQNRLAYSKFVDPIIRYFKRIFDVKLIASGSLFDHYTIELVKAAKSYGIRWLVCEREGTQSQCSSKELAKYLIRHDVIHVDYITTANVLHRECFRTGATKRGTVQVELVGELRSDRWVERNYKFRAPEYVNWNAFKKSILFLAFGIRHYIEPFDHPHIKSANWCQLIDETQEELFNFAKNHPDVLVFYKTGHIEKYHDKFINRVKSNNIKNICILSRFFPCEELIEYVDLIAGFQSTAMIEAMFTSKPILYTFWGIHPEVDVEEDIMPLHTSGAVTVMKSPKILRDMLIKWSQSGLRVSPEELSARKICREFYFYKPDGFVAERVINIISELIGNKLRLPVSRDLK